MRHTAAKAVAALAITTALTAVAVPAMADPAVTPAAQDIVGAGSDTTQAVFNKFSTDYNASLTDPALPRLYSWDATGTATITPKTGAATINRPNGSSSGINALNANTNATLDFARSSRSASATDPATDLFLPFAQDGITWASTQTSNSPTNLTKADLQGIYTCTITSWAQITDIPTYVGPPTVIKPFLPQAGSGTRSTFLKTLGDPVSGPLVPGACVDSSVEENQGTDPKLNDSDALVPYSAGHYAGQLNGFTTVTDAPGPLVLQQVDGITPLATIGFRNVVSDALVNSVYGRKLFNVVRTGDWNAVSTQATALRAIFSSTGWICTNATAATDINDYGFQTMVTGCGVA